MPLRKMAAPTRTILLGKFCLNKCNTLGSYNSWLAVQTARPIHTFFRSAGVQLQAASCQVQPSRNSPNIFNKLTGDELWEGVISVSNAGKKKGRGKRVGRKKTMNLNIGQNLGDGKANMVWPGLNTRVFKNNEMVKISQLPPDPDRQDRLARLRDMASRIKYPSTPPIIRGYTGGRMTGLHYGPPDPVLGNKFEGFDSVLLELKLVSNMTGTLGRKQHFTAFMVVGNGNGLAGYGLGRGTRILTAVRVAKNRAAQRLCYIPRLNDHTVYHSMFSHYHHSKIFIHKKEKGYGLAAHRNIISCCKMMGIKDLHCKVEGSTKNVKAVTKGFFNAIVTQETHQDLADRCGYHLVQFRGVRDNLPEVLASPSVGRTETEVFKHEGEDIELDFERLYFDGKKEFIKPAKNPFAKLPGFKRRERQNHIRRNQHGIHIQRLAGLV